MRCKHVIPSEVEGSRRAYVITVVITPEKMRTALIDGELSKKYFFGHRVESDWKVGSAFKMWQPNDTLDGGRL